MAGLSVEFRGLSDAGKDVSLGSVELVGGRLAVAPGGRPMLREVLAQPVHDPEDGREVDPESEPEEWLRLARFNFHGAYLRACKPTAPPEPAEPTPPPEPAGRVEKAAPAVVEPEAAVKSLTDKIMGWLGGST